MAESSFNITAFARRLGLKNVKELPLIERVQPVVSVGEFAPLTPALVPPAFIAGGLLTAVVGEVGALAVQALGPGGTFVTLLSTAISARVAIVGVNPGLATTLVLSAASNEGAGVSRVTMGTQVSTLTNVNASILAGQVIPPLYIPRGQFFLVEANIVNVVQSFAVFGSDVPASEDVPS